MLGDAGPAAGRQGAFVSPTLQPQPAAGEPGAARATARRSPCTGVKLDDWNYAMPEDDFVMEKVGFQALWVKVEDATAATRAGERVAWPVH